MESAHNGWDGITLALRTDTLSKHRAKATQSLVGCASTMYTTQVAAKDKHLIFAESLYSRRSDTVIVYSRWSDTVID